MSFRLVPKSVTLNGIMAVILCYFGKLGSLDAHCVKWLNFLRQKCSPAFLVFSDLSFTMLGTPPSGGLNARGLAKYSDFGPIVGYILETVQDRR